ncbi:MAG: 4-(cytidine 5'-diphospho)-2-C-methyl-D-erythritol kinase [Cyclobacteriaceae bacterium]|nr:4-(cytidine 5'-diphospho)-2-C-methyl-D-erythritol kinase [Cyclobacteriaceae bacterium]
MVSFPGCKINLGLHILRRRPDGFHDLDTCFYPLPWSDVLEWLPADTLSFASTGLPIPGAEEDNLCLKAYHLLRREHSLPPAQGHLHKIVPMGAGLGGGSADGAFTLRSLNELFSLNLSISQLTEYARQLGSDCACFLLNGAARGTGRGDHLEPLNLQLRGYYLVLVTPPVHVSTAQAYAGVTPRQPDEALTLTLARPLREWKDVLVNDFEPTVFARFPELAAIKEKMYANGALYASMSGSGSSIFGIFPDEVDREKNFPSLPGWSGWL